MCTVHLQAASGVRAGRLCLRPGWGLRGEEHARALGIRRGTGVTNLGPRACHFPAKMEGLAGKINEHHL